MSVLTRYLLRCFFSLLGLILPGIIGVYLLVEAFERIDDFIEAKVPLSLSLAYFALKIPPILFELNPLAILLAGLLTVMLLARHSELLALRAAGVNPHQVIVPFLGAALGLSFLLLLAQALYIPRALARADDLWQVEIRKKPPRGLLRDARLFYHGEKSIWTTELGSPDATKLNAVQRLVYDSIYEVAELIAAEEATFEDDQWRFHRGIRKVREADGNWVVQTFEHLTLPLPETPKDFVALETPPAQMDALQLWRHIHRLKRAGYKAFEERATFWGQLLYPFLGLSLLVLGLPMVLTRERGGLTTGLGLGMVGGFAAWVGWSLVLTLGKTGKIPPELAPILVHALLLASGAWLYRRMRF